MAESLLSHFEAGEGIPVVFIHGFCENKEIWRDFVQPLSQKARVIVIDLPGFGDNPELTAPVTVADFAEAIFHFLQQKGVERCIMIGHSLGGYWPWLSPKSSRNVCVALVFFIPQPIQTRLRRNKAVTKQLTS